MENASLCLVMLTFFFFFKKKIGLPLNPIEKEMCQNWKTAMLSIKPLVAHRVCQNTDLYPTIVDRYMEGINQANWKVKIWAVSGQKPKGER